MKTLPWIDLSAYRLRLLAVELANQKRILVVQGDITSHQAALVALGFVRTPRGHIIYPEATLRLKQIQSQLPQAVRREMPLHEIVRLNARREDNTVRPSTPPPASTASTPAATTTSTTATSAATIPDTAHPAPSGGVREGEFLGINRRGQGVFKDVTGERYLQGEPQRDFGPMQDLDYLRSENPGQLPALVSGLVYRAEQGARIESEHLRLLTQHIEGACLPARTGFVGEDMRRCHLVQEALEAATVARARERFAPVRAGSSDGLNLAALKTAYEQAVALTTHLPPHRFRSAATIARAQYSTPLPLALAAQVALGPIGSGRVILEPCAGHGMLLSALPHRDRHILAVEIDTARAERLYAQFPNLDVDVGDVLKVSSGDLAADYIIANPPFGALQSVTGQREATVQLPEAPAFKTQRLGHAILLNTLAQRHPQGRAVFIIAGDHPRNHDLDKPAGGSRYLLNYLADHYHVEAVVGIHGDLYRSQGSQYPLRLVVIGEQGTGFTPVPETTPVVNTWDELYQVTAEQLATLAPARLEQAAPRTPSSVDSSVTAPMNEATTLDESVQTEANTANTTSAAPSAESPEDSIEPEPVYQERYTPRSQIGEALTMIPANMALATRNALDRVEAAHGCSVDDFVARELQRDPEGLGEHFSPEQVDALALALHALKTGRGFIEADETGIGKGRVLAGLTHWAWLQQRPVIFLTEKPNLFSDFYRDLGHIGLHDQTKLLVVNAGTPIKDTERGQTLIPGTPSDALKPWLERDELPPGINLVLLTYSQINRAMTSALGEKARWLAAIAEKTGAMVIVDESHNAAGDSNTHNNVKAILDAGDYAVFSSATYAKRTDNLALYASVLPERYKNDDIGGLLHAGGAPLQEIFSQMLAEDGVLIRREHDLSLLTFVAQDDSERLSRNQRLANQLASILEKLAFLGGDIERWVSEQLQDQYAERADGVDSEQRRGNRAGLQSMNFGSRLYQLNRLFLMALKVEAATEFAIEEIKAGHKPVMVIENTMESLLRAVIQGDYEPQDPPGPLDPLEDDAQDSDAGGPEVDAESALGTYPLLSYRDALQRVADRMMVYTSQGRYGDVTRHTVTDKDLIELYQSLTKDIQAFPSLDLSPLDSIRSAIEEAGFACGELSGRKLWVSVLEPSETDDPQALEAGETRETGATGRRMVVRPRAVENRSDLIFKFNTGVYDALIVTRSGSSGLSLHARDDVPGWSPAPRSLYELQIPQNVAERIQFWGRVNRRGQCCPPTIVTPSSGLPGEVRLISMQNAKLRALSANTTSNRDSAAITRTIPDILNPIGNKVARDWVRQNPLEASTLQADTSESRDRAPMWYVNRVSSRIMLLPIERQEQVLEQLAGNYTALLEQYRAAGFDPFRTAEADWRAREVDRSVFEGAADSTASMSSVFDAPVNFTVVEYDQAIDPYRAEDVEHKIRQNRGFYNKEAALAQLNEVSAVKLHKATLPSGSFKGVESLQAGLEGEGDNPVKRTYASLQNIQQFLQHADVGHIIAWPEPVDVEQADGEQLEMAGRIISLVVPDKASAHLAGQYLVQMAVPGAERAKVKSIFALAKTGYQVSANAHDTQRLMRAFDDAEAGTFTRRANLLNGNLYAALQIATARDLGQPLIYTNREGKRERAVLLKSGIGMDELKLQPLVLRGYALLRQFLDDNAQDKTLLRSGNGVGKLNYRTDVVLEVNRGVLTLSVPGAKLHNSTLLAQPAWQQLDINEKLTGNSTAMKAAIEDAEREAIVRILADTYTWAAQPQYRDWYNETIQAPPKPDNDMTPASNTVPLGATLTP